MTNLECINIDAIKARLGSIPAAKVNVMPEAQRRLLQEDLPQLLRFYESMRKLQSAKWIGGLNEMPLLRKQITPAK